MDSEEKRKAILEDIITVRNGFLELLNIASELRDLLAENTDYGEWTHAHCDETLDGMHRIDYDWLERDAQRAIEKFDEFMDKEV